MNPCFRLLMLLVFMIASQALLGMPAAAQDTAAAAATSEDSAISNLGAEEEEEEGFWAGLASSILDLFGADSDEADEADGQILEGLGEEGVGGERGQALHENSRRDRLQELKVTRHDERAADDETIAGDGIAPHLPHRRLNPRHIEMGETELTPSHAYQATVDLISEINVLRKAMNVNGSPGGPKFQEHQAPIHAYTKSLEVLEKAARVQRRLGMIPAEMGQVPVKAVAPGDVYDAVQTIIEELRRVKRQLVIGDEIEPAPFVSDKSPILVYRNLVHASLLLDGLVGRPTTPNDVFLNVMRVRDELALIAAELSIPLEAEPPALQGGKEPVAVAQQVLRAANKIVRLQDRLGMDASRVPDFVLEGVTSADIYDATNFLLAEVSRIKIHLRVQQGTNGRREARNRTTADVFAQVLLVIRNLDIMSKAADGTG